MPSVTRDKKKYGAPTVYGRTSENEKRRQADREFAKAQEMALDRRRRDGSSEYYHTGRVRPLIEEE